MKRMLNLLGVVALVALPAMAQTQEASTLAIDQPVQVGAKVLQPGVYTVRLLPTFAERMKVQFTSVDGKKIYASVLTVPHPLNATKDEPRSTFVFYNDASGAPVALRTWFPAPASALGGHDFVYDEGRARQLARLSHTNVVSYNAPETADLDTAPLNVITPEETVQPYTPPVAGSMTSSAPAPVETSTVTTQTQTTETTSTPPVQIAEATPVQTEQNEQPMSMPHTASDLPLAALLGVAALGGALAIRAARQA